MEIPPRKSTALKSLGQKQTSFRGKKLGATSCLSCGRAGAGHLGFAVLQCSNTSYLLATLTKKLSTSGTDLLKQPIPSKNSFDRNAKDSMFHYIKY